MRACIDGHRQRTAAATAAPRTAARASHRPSRTQTPACATSQGWRASRCMLHAPHTPGVMCTTKRGCTGAEAQRRGRGEHSHRTFRVPTSTSCPYASDLITNKSTCWASPKRVHERAGRIATRHSRRAATVAHCGTHHRIATIVDKSFGTVSGPSGGADAAADAFALQTCQALHRCEPRASPRRRALRARAQGGARDRVRRPDARPSPGDRPGGQQHAARAVVRKAAQFVQRLVHSVCNGGRGDRRCS